jgi:hypothetical protein
MVTINQSFTSANSQHTFTTSNEANGVEVTLKGGKGGRGGSGNDGFEFSPESGESAGEITVLLSGEITNRTFTLFVGQQGGPNGTRSAGSSPFQGGISGSTGSSGERKGDNDAGDGGGGGAPSAIELNGNVIAVAGGGDGGRGANSERTEDFVTAEGGGGGSSALGNNFYQQVSTANDNQTLFSSTPNISVSVQQSTSTNDSPSITVTEIQNPPAVNSLSATPTANGSINLSWLNPSDSVTKEVYRSSSHTGNATEIATIGSSRTSFTDSGLEFNQSYVYYLKQVDSEGDKRGVVTSARTPKRDVLRYDGDSNEWIPTDLTTL